MLFASLPLLLFASSTLAHPLSASPLDASSASGPILGHKHITAPIDGRAETTGWDGLYNGHKSFLAEMESDHAGLIEDLATNGQHPEFVVIGCSDSRVDPETIFDALPGTIFGERSVANLFRDDDLHSGTILSYSVEHLHSQHIVVMGHYGCGGVSAAIASPPPDPLSSFDQSIQEWIKPIRELYDSSEREEIVAFRNEHASNDSIASPGLHDAVFRALVEENVKQSVLNLAGTAQIAEMWGNSSNAAVFIYGLVYDIEDGQVYNLNVTMGPSGQAIPEVPFGLLGA
ncbi:carbonic anhydrase [Hymenopellis radicata]|nr:carbonic anhydrase [Hymenopellis radicata]